MSNSCRNDLKNYILRKLGSPAIQINVTDEQIYDRIDDALDIYWEWHHEGTFKDYVTHIMTADNILTKTIPIDEWIYTVIRIISLGGPENSVNLEYQSYMQNIGTQLMVQDSGILNYTINESYFNLVDSFFRRQKIIDFNQRHNILHIRSDINYINEGDIIVFEVYRLNEPDKYKETWNDWWLKKYVTELVKKQWGQNMSKYDGIQLPGGITLNGRQIYDDAQQQIERLEEQLLESLTLPIDFLVG